jgi:octaprenyl-diphosphate synthase
VISAAGDVTLPQLQAGLEERLETVQGEIGRIVAADLDLITQVNAHLLRMQGKLFRPTLLLLVDEATGAYEARAPQLAAVVELIHLAMPTVNALFSHQVSVIMGDYLYSRAVIELIRLGDLEPLQVLARVTNEMTIGEMRQLLAHDGLRYTETDYDALIRSKTASLLSGTAEVGALRAEPAVRRAMARFGENLGMAFQIVDDLLDFTEPESVTGKPSGLDLKEHKITLPLIHALPRMTDAQRQQVARLMTTPEPSGEQIASVVAGVGEAGGLAYARRRAQEFAARAEAELEVLPSSPARETLRASLTYVLDRKR